MTSKTGKVNRKLKAAAKSLSKKAFADREAAIFKNPAAAEAGMVEARTVTVKDEWGVERVVGGFGDVGVKKLSKEEKDQIRRAITDSSKREAELEREEDLHRKELGIKRFEEPERCVKCGSTEPMEYHLCSLDGATAQKDGVPGWICIACGHAHLETNDDGPGYSDKLEADIQVSTEEAIAAAIFDYEGEKSESLCGSSDVRTLDEEDCAKLGRDILKTVLGRFRPDLFDTNDELNFYLLTGDILHAGRVRVAAKDIDDAIDQAENGAFVVHDEEGKGLGFNWNGDKDSIEKIKR